MESRHPDLAMPRPADWTESIPKQEDAGTLAESDALVGAGPDSEARPVHRSFPSVESSVRPTAERRAERAGSLASAPAAGGGGTVLFDVETLRSAAEVGGWHRAYRMGIAVAVVCRLEEGTFEVYREADVPRLVGALKGAARVVGFNSRRFDYAVISGYTGEDYGRSLPTLDLLESLRERLRYRVGLGHVARETLGVDKSADGLRSLEWVRAGRLDLVEQYCLKDVEILRDLYLFGRREGYVVIADRAAGRVRVRVDW
jgi:DEAD/DEAH box helicase domain-containing protein